MIHILVGILLAQSAPSPQVEKQTPNPIQVDQETTEKLLKAKRIFVESFGDDGTNRTLQSMIVDSLRSSHRFIVTENKDKADLILKGAALEKTSQELHAVGSATAVAGAAGGHSASGIEDSRASTETINDARVAVRLVSSDGDVVWSTTQESKGAKYKGASADVSDKIVKQLLRDIEKLTPPQPGANTK